MYIRRKHAGLAAVLMLLVAIPTAAQVGGYGGMGGFGGLISGAGFGAASPDVPSVRPWLSVNGNVIRYYDGIGSPPRNSYGSSIGGGVSVSKAWARTSLVGSYTAGGFLVNPYKRYGTSSGISQVVGLQVMRQVSQRLAVSVSGFGGSSNGGYGVGAGLGGIGNFAPVGISPTVNPSQGQTNSSNIDLGFQNFGDNGLVDNELFDTRVNFVGVNAGGSYTPDQRNIFSFSGGASQVRRSLSYLVGLNSLGGGAGYTRVLTQSLTMGASYRFGSFEYPGYYGGNQVHSAGLSVGYRINPKTSFSVHAGGYIYRVNNVGTIVLPPEMAAILGQSTVQQVNDTRFTGMSAGASLTRSLRVGAAGLTYNRGARPGNGLIFPTEQETVALNYSVGKSRYSLGTAGYFSRGKSISNIAGTTQTKTLLGFFSLRVFGSLHFSSSVSHRWVDAGLFPSRRLLSANAGLAFSPGAFPMWF